MNIAYLLIMMISNRRLHGMRLITKTRQISMLTDDAWSYEFMPDRMKNAWVLIFDAESVDEGVYTILDKRSNFNALVSFESYKDAYTFASLLVSNGFEMATPVCWDASRIVEFCKMGHYALRFPDGKVPTAPLDNWYSKNVRQDLELLLSKDVENCTDDDCTFN